MSRVRLKSLTVVTMKYFSQVSMQGSFEQQSGSVRQIIVYFSHLQIDLTVVSSIKYFVEIVKHSISYRGGEFGTLHQPGTTLII